MLIIMTLYCRYNVFHFLNTFYLGQLIVSIKQTDKMIISQSLLSVMMRVFSMILPPHSRVQVGNILLIQTHINCRNVPLTLLQIYYTGTDINLTLFIQHTNICPAHKYYHVRMVNWRPGLEQSRFKINIFLCVNIQVTSINGCSSQRINISYKFLQ